VASARWLRVKEAAARLEVEPKTVCRLVALDLRPRSSASLNRTADSLSARRRETLIPLGLASAKPNTDSDAIRTAVPTEAEH